MKRIVMLTCLTVMSLSLQAAVKPTPPENPVIPFLAITGKPAEADAIDKVRRMKAAGFDAFLIYARSGLQYKYMGEEWLTLCEQLCREAEKQGMHIWLYDEYNWPSGTCKGKVPSENDAWRYVETALYRKADGAYEWKETQAPAGWVNVLEPDAVKRFIELTHCVYQKRLAAWLANGTIRGIFSDEPGHPVGIDFKGKPAAHFRSWRSLPDDYRTETGRDFKRDVETWLNAVSADKNSDAAVKTSEVWVTYSALMGRQFRKSYFDQIRAKCDEMGILLTGHLISENSLTGSCRCNGDPLLVIKGETLPGIDEISSRSKADDAEWLTLNLAQHASLRNGIGALAELFALGPCDMNPARLRQMFWLCALHNIDHYLTSMHVMDMKGLVEKHGYLSPMNESQPWYKLSPLLIEDAKTAARFARKTTFDCPVAVRYPQRLAALTASAERDLKEPPLRSLLGAFNTRQISMDLFGETETTDKPFVFSLTEEGLIKEERSGRSFKTANDAAAWLHPQLKPRLRVLTPDGSVAGDIIVRNYDDGTTVILNLADATDRPLIAETAAGKTLFLLPARGVMTLAAGETVRPFIPETVSRLTGNTYGLELSAGNLLRINFDTDKTGVINVAAPLKNVRLALRTCAVSYAVTSGGRPVELFEFTPKGEKIFKHIAEPYTFTMDGKPLAAAEPCSILRPTFNSLYAQTAPFDLEPGLHTFTIKTGETDQNYFLPALFLAGDFSVFYQTICPRPTRVPAAPLACLGLDGFVGTATYTTLVNVPSRNGLRLRLNTDGHFVSVKLGGRDLGVRSWAPFEWSIPDGLKGKKEIELTMTVYTSVAPMFGYTDAPGAHWDIRMWLSPRTPGCRPGLCADPEWIW